MASKKKFPSFSTSTFTLRRVVTFSLFSWWCFYAAYYKIKNNSSVGDVVRNFYFYQIFQRRMLFQSDQDESTNNNTHHQREAEFYEAAALFTRDSFFRKLTRFQDPLPNHNFASFVYYNPFPMFYTDLRPALVGQLASTTSSTTTISTFLDGPQSVYDLIPLPRFLFPYRADRNKIFRSAIGAYLEFEGRKIDLRVAGYATKTTKDRIIENTLVARHPWLLSAKTERLVMDYYTGNFLYAKNQNNNHLIHVSIPHPLAHLIQKYWFERRYNKEFITTMRIIFQQRSLKSVTQLWHMKGGQVEVPLDEYFFIKKNGDSNEPLSSSPSAKWSFDGYSRMKALLLIRKILHDQQQQQQQKQQHDRINYDEATVNAVLDRALLYAQCRIGNSFKPRNSSKSVSNSESELSASSLPSSFFSTVAHFASSCLASCLSQLPEPRPASLWRNAWPSLVKELGGERYLLDAVCARLANNEAVPLATGTSSHSVAMLLAPNFVVVSNRGSGAGGHDRFGFSVYSFYNEEDVGKRFFDDRPRSETTTTTSAISDDQSRKWLSKIVLGGLKSEDLVPTTSDSNNKEKIPSFLRNLLSSTTTKIKFEGVVPMRKQLSGDCSFESSAKPLMLLGLALSRQRRMTAECRIDDDQEKNFAATTLPAPPDAQTFMHQMRQCYPRYFRLAAYIKHDQLLEYFRHYRHRQYNNDGDARDSPRFLLRLPDRMVIDNLVVENNNNNTSVAGVTPHNKILAATLRSMARRPSNISPEMATKIVAEFLRNDDDNNKIDGKSHHIVGNAQLVEELLALSPNTHHRHNNNMKHASPSSSHRHYLHLPYLHLFHFAAMSGCNSTNYSSREKCNNSSHDSLLDEIEEACRRHCHHHDPTMTRTSLRFNDRRLDHDLSLLTIIKESSTVNDNTKKEIHPTSSKSNNARVVVFRSATAFDAVSQLREWRRKEMFQYGVSTIPLRKDLDRVLEKVSK